MNGVHSPESTVIELPTDLEQRVLTQFDELVSKERIIYEVTSAEVVNDDGFRVSEHREDLDPSRKGWAVQGLYPDSELVG